MTRKLIKVWINEDQADGIIHNRTDYSFHRKFAQCVKNAFGDINKSQERYNEVCGIVNDKICHMPAYVTYQDEFYAAENKLIKEYHNNSGLLYRNRQTWLDSFINNELDKLGITDFRYDGELYNVAERAASEKRNAENLAQLSGERGGCPIARQFCSWDYRYKETCPGLRGGGYTMCPTYIRSQQIIDKNKGE